MTRTLRDLLLELLVALHPDGKGGVNLKAAADALGMKHTTLFSYVTDGKYWRLPTPRSLRSLMDGLGATDAQREDARRLLEEADATRPSRNGETPATEDDSEAVA